MAQFPARTWAEHGYPSCGVWMGWANDDQPYLHWRRVELSEYGDGTLVLARFSDGDIVKFLPGTPFRLGKPILREAS